MNKQTLFVLTPTHAICTEVQELLLSNGYEWCDAPKKEIKLHLADTYKHLTCMIFRPDGLLQCGNYESLSVDKTCKEITIKEFFELDWRDYEK